jgi:hypothetical protein
MLNALKRWLQPQTQTAPSWGDVAEWAQARGHVFKRIREGTGFVVDGRLGGASPAGSHAAAVPTWRLEWGPSQRFYISGHELRLRADLRAPPDLQMLILSKTLMRALEEETFESFTDSLKTYADDSAPEEMRWLAMFGKPDAATLGPLALHFGAVALVPSTVSAWVQGSMAEHLLRLVAVGRVGPDRPCVLMVQRGRLLLRATLEEPSPQAIQAWLNLLDLASESIPAAVDALEQAVRRARPDSVR